MGPSTGSNVENLCDEEYTRKTSRTFRERFKEHLKDPSPIHHHSTTCHITTQDNIQIIGREDHGIARTIKESIHIRVNNLTLNRNIGRFNLHHVLDRVLLNTPGLKLMGMYKIYPHQAFSVCPTNTPMHNFTGSMEHAQTIPWSEQHFGKEYK